MNAMRARARVTSWIAVLAMLLASLAPALSHALASAAAASWVEICTAQGSKWILADEDRAERERVPVSTNLTDHCPCCRLQALTLGLPPAEPVVHALLPLAHEAPRAVPAAPASSCTWIVALPRAPPPLS